MKLCLPIACLVLLIAGCAALEIPPDKATWAQSVREQIRAANDTNYVYVRVASKEETQMVERIARQQGKESQPLKHDGLDAVCVFRFHPAYYLR